MKYKQDILVSIYSGRICGPKNDRAIEDEGESESLMPQDNDTEPIMKDHVVAHVPESVSMIYCCMNVVRF